MAQPRLPVVPGCSASIFLPTLGEKLRGEADYRIIAVEPASCPSFTRGVYAYDFCDTGMVCPLAKMYTLGSDFKYPVPVRPKTIVFSSPVS